MVGGDDSILMVGLSPSLVSLGTGLSFLCSRPFLLLLELSLMADKCRGAGQGLSPFPSVKHTGFCLSGNDFIQQRLLHAD